jgi:hypothetical protein
MFVATSIEAFVLFCFLLFTLHSLFQITSTVVVVGSVFLLQIDFGML